MTPSPLEELAEIERALVQVRDELLAVSRASITVPAGKHWTQHFTEKGVHGQGKRVAAAIARLAAARGAMDGMLANERKEALADAARACIFNPPTLTAAVYDGFELGQAACIEQIRILKGRP